MVTSTKFHTRLKKCRIEKGLTQGELGELTGLSNNNVSHYETGGRIPRLDTLVCIANALNVSLDYLAGQSEVRGTPLTSNSYYGNLLALATRLSNKDQNLLLDFTNLLDMRAKRGK